MSAVDRKRERHRLDAIFCDALANGASVRGAGRAIGCTNKPASERFARIRRELGEQAA